ncbi:MAG: HAMP domain-containing protein [Bacteroidetes bacterium]|jgi:signal transduction histidine kinase|nr:HAMP domain-containing protein [Bacteroidota bacterium]
MEHKKVKVFSKLYWKISAIFLIVFVVFAAAAIYIFVQSAREYSVEVNQQMNRDLAGNTVDVIKPYIINEGEVNQEAMEEMLHSMMVINPSIEIYILDTEGNILSYLAPYKVVKLEEVSLDPVHKFLNDSGKSVIYGDDPRNPGESKIFSATEIVQDNQLVGYLYIVLASQEYESAAQMVLGSYIMGLSIQSVVVILIISALVGLLAIWFIVKRLNMIINGIQNFRAGNLKARIPAKSNGELDKIAVVFNEMAETIEENVKKLTGIDELRKELISNVSHDLRTPVAAIKGYAETLILKKESHTHDEQEKYLKIIDRSCERLQKLVTDLFELSKLQTNQVQLQLEPFSIAELVHDVANKYRLISQKNGISINTVVSQDIPIVEADLSLIDRVLQNLMDNAIRFCKDGDTITLNINPVDPEKVQIRISDSGDGIKPEILPHIFERYFKSKDYKQSSGLGLAIVKKIIDLHQTTINVESLPGKGTTFYFTLPVAKTA